MGGVSLIAEATERSVGIVGAVASGAGECLDLDLEPATRLHAIAIEAASNVVTHAYPGSAGPIELEISAAADGELQVTVRDSGDGMLPPTIPFDPPGLGLTLICSLADEIEISSTRTGGTAVAATIRTAPEGEDLRDAAPDTDPRSGGSLTFTGSTFVEAVLPRTLAALVAGTTVAMDVLTSVLRLGDAVAYGLSSCIEEDERASVYWDGDSPREVRIGPLRGDGAEDLVNTVSASRSRQETGPGLRTAISGRAGNFALVGLPQVHI